jgi:drug/metabolite transporter (DMT)-like permease
MIGPSALEGLGSNIIAQAAVLSAALSYAFAGVYGRRFKAMSLHPTVAAAGQVTASSIFLIPLLYLSDQTMALSSVSMLAWIAVLGLAILSTAIAYTLYFHILASAGATNLLLVTFLIPVSAVVLGIFVLEETLEYVHVIGMFFIMLGLIAIDGRLWAFKHKQ